MYNNEELEVLAQQAKQQLENQGNEEEDSIVDYSNLFNDVEEDSNNYEEGNNVEEESNSYEELPKLDPFDEPLFPGGPGKKQIQAWKKEWEGYDIYITEILNKTFIFRTLNRFEYKQLVTLQNIDALQREEIVCQTVTLWPYDYDWRSMATAQAGIPSTYSEIVMEKSGFTKDYALQVI